MRKAHSIIYTKTCNKSQHVRVKKLLYWYINLCSIKNSNSDQDDFFLSGYDGNNEEEADRNNRHGADVGVVRQDGQEMVQREKMEDTNNLLIRDE